MFLSNAHILLVIVVSAITIYKMLAKFSKYDQGAPFTDEQNNTLPVMSFLLKLIMVNNRMISDVPTYINHQCIVIGFVLSIFGHFFPPICMAGGACLFFAGIIALYRAYLNHRLHTDVLNVLFSLILLGLSGITIFIETNFLNTSKLFHVSLHWFHAASIAYFITLIPITRLSHFITTTMHINSKTLSVQITRNPLFSDSTSKLVANISENDNTDAEEFDTISIGIGSTSSLSSKVRLELDCCTECGRCEKSCPVYSEVNDFSPMKITKSLRHYIEQHPLDCVNAKQYIDNAILCKMIWQCTMCGKCEETCPIFIERIGIIIGIRRNLVLQHGIIPTEFRSIITKLERFGNVWGNINSDIFEQFNPLPDRHLTSNEVAVWLGCFYSFDPHLRKNALAFLTKLKKSGITFYIIGKSMCCGDILRKLGDEFTFQEVVKKNINTLSKIGNGTLIVLCPHCLDTFKNSYSEFGLKIRVAHYLEQYSDLFTTICSQSVDNGYYYHEPCYLRTCKETAANPIKGFSVSPSRLCNEPPQGFCCGGGGAQIFKETFSGQNVGKSIVFYANKNNTKGVLTSCPYCNIMLRDLSKADDIGPPIYDLLEMIDIYGE